MTKSSFQTPPHSTNASRVFLLRIVVATCVVAIGELLLFELIRTPYRPPAEMSTFLGTEKYAVIFLMGLLLVVGSGLVVCWIVRSAFTLRDLFVYMAVLAVLFGAGGFLVRNPPWFVTPLDLIFR